MAEKYIYNFSSPVKNFSLTGSGDRDDIRKAMKEVLSLYSVYPESNSAVALQQEIEKLREIDPLLKYDIHRGQ